MLDGPMRGQAGHVTVQTIDEGSSDLIEAVVLNRPKKVHVVLYHDTLGHSLCWSGDDIDPSLGHLSPVLWPRRFPSAVKLF